jgi:hypothetical protein
MANSRRPSFLKRQKEQQRLARADAKRQARRARRLERAERDDATATDDDFTTADALGMGPAEADEAEESDESATP